MVASTRFEERATEPVRYWINLFTAQTWHTSREDARTAAWFESRNRKLTRELKPGDLIICYVARIGFTSVLRATGEAETVADGPFGDAFPVTVPAETIFEVALHEAMPLARLTDALGLQRTPTYLVQGSGSEWRADFGEPLVDAFQAWAQAPERQTLTPRQLDYTPSGGLASSLGHVTVPDDADDENAEEPGPVIDEAAHSISPSPQGEVTEHVRVQAQLLRIGHLLGHTPWVTTDDQSKLTREGDRLADLPGATTELPPQFDEATNRTIRHIDVMWLHRNRVDAAFEVESTTSIYSGLLRMADLLALQPNISIPLFIVVPDNRLDRALEELARPVFRGMVQPLPKACRVITFSRLSDLEDLVQRAGGHLTTGVLDEFSESVPQ